MAIKNYTTTVAATKTVAEIQTILTNAGATRIVLENNSQRQPVSLAFILHNLSYRLPCRHNEVHRLLYNDRNVERRYKTEEQALRVAWRILKDWCAAQLAIIETEMVSADEVLLPYRLLANGQTVYDEYNVKQITVSGYK